MRATSRISSITGWFVIAAVLLGLSLCHADPKDLVLTKQDNGRTVAAVVTQSILVQLRGNATTGYTWTLKSTNGNSVVATGPSTYVPDAGGAIGAGGTFTFPFVAMNAGQTILSFSYEQAWDPASVAKTFTVSISVAEQPAAPRLSIMARGANVIVSWPIAGSNGFYLEGTRILSSGWAALNVLQIPDGENNTVMLPASGQLLFFRLRQ